MAEFDFSRRFLGMAINTDEAPEGASVEDLETVIDRAMRRGVGPAFNADLTASMMALGAQCLRSAPPASISIITDAAGGLVAQCSHQRPHRWPL